MWKCVCVCVYVCMRVCIGGGESNLSSSHTPNKSMSLNTKQSNASIDVDNKK